MFGDMVRTYRRRLGLSQEDLAAKAGVSVRTIGKIEANRIAAPRPATVRLLGEVFGLHGEARERFCAQAASALEADPAPDPAPNALPAAPPAFTGRDEHLTQLDSLLSGVPPTPVAAVTGSGGIGKTALALHWAHRCQHEFPDGLLYVDLRGFSHRPPLPPVEALWRLLHQLGVPPEKIPMHEEYAADLYRAQVSGKRILVLLDNARNSEHVRPLLPGGLTCRALVTSRTDLSGLVARDGAKPVRLDVLSATEARRLLVTILDTDVDIPDLDELAQLCAYVPLALRIAAASLVGQPAQRLRHYVEQLRSADRLGTLQLDGDDHTAMGATLQLSYELLEPAAQRLFRLLSLVEGSDFTLDTAADLAGVPGSQARGMLAALAGAHLVQERTPGRYGFHDLLRLYAATLLTTEESETERQQGLERLYAHYLNRVDAAARLLYPQVLRLPMGPRAEGAIEYSTDAEAIAWLDSERKNLVAAISAGADRGQRQAVCHLADAMRGYFFLRMLTVDWHAVAHAAFQAAHACDDRPAQAAALLSLADLHWRQGEYDAADAAYGHAVEHAVAGGWIAGHATALGNLGGLRRMQGRLIEAAQLIRQSLARNVEVGRTAGQAVNLGNLSLVYGELGDWEQAQIYGTQAYELHRQIGSRTAQAVALSNLGETSLRLGRFDLARERLQRALDMHRELGDKAAEATTLRDLAWVHQETGEPRRALELARSAVALAEHSEDQRVVALCLQTTAAIAHLTGDDETAVRLGSRSVELARSAGHRMVQTLALLGLAAIHRGRGEDAPALGLAREGLLIADRSGYLGLANQAASTVAELETALLGRVL
ncbi:hypothetical protein Rhe02_64970 [Rhizocola hellebori]|uniref:HTH cro/C1-type domain-containing protein n=1 Tax=Rhizocola hellebori TaxID=1392758 RepID=A0A8J3QD27_9ACTN|nr:helix-turn-helix domain-containing protein [Rhizocola hellebori]GIH08430.1 hypothetical protein Rhe02_64970 [Rhizocola hellebori]